MGKLRLAHRIALNALNVCNWRKMQEYQRNAAARILRLAHGLRIWRRGVDEVRTWMQ
jgi:hypothetical protein